MKRKYLINGKEEECIILLRISKKDSEQYKILITKRYEGREYILIDRIANIVYKYVN